MRNGQTVVSTVPATLLDAVPSGTLNATMTAHSASDARAARRAFARASAASVVCKGSATASIKPSPSFHAPSVTLKGSWKLFGGLQSVSLTADANESAGITATVQGQGSCTLAKTPVLSFPGPSVDTFVGPIPVVITSKITVYLDAAAAINASATASASIGFSASAGIGWAKGRGFYPIQTFTPHLGFTPPSLSADGSVAANLTPTIDVLLYGVVGPQLALRGGLALGANIHQNPWWTLTAPVDLTASIAIPPLKLTSPTLHVYQRTFNLADAGGPFGGGAGGGAGGSGSSGSGPVGGQPVQAIADGGLHSCALLSEGQIECWGDNSNGELGNGTSSGPDFCRFPCSTTPVAVLRISSAIRITASAFHSCALLSGGQVECWGGNSFGELGNGTTTSSDVPVEVSGISNATAIADGGIHACAVLSGGQMYCWGANYQGQLGDGTTSGPQACAHSTACSTTPVAVSGISNATAVAAGNEHSCALLSGGKIACWGADSAGQLGNGTTTNNSPTPVPVSGISNATAIAGADSAHTCALSSGGHVECWGLNLYGQLGNGTTTTSDVPVEVSGISNATAIAAGGYSSCALLSGGHVECWGYNEFGIWATGAPLIARLRWR